MNPKMLFRWFHGLCINVDPNAYTNDTPFECEICSGNLTIPLILAETPVPSPGKIFV